MVAVPGEFRGDGAWTRGTSAIVAATFLLYPRSFYAVVSILRPDEKGLSPSDKDQVQVHRLLGLLAAVLIPPFGYLFEVTNPGAVDPWWVRLGIAGLYGSMIVGSYVSRVVRRRIVELTWGLCYVVTLWVAVVAATNHFPTTYAVILLVTHVLVTAAVGLGADEVGPVVRILGFGPVATAGAAILFGAPRVEALLIVGSMAMLGGVGSILMRAYFSAQEKIRSQEQRLRTITENVSDGIYRSVPGEGLVYANQGFAEMFGYDSVDEILEADPNSLYANPEQRDELHETVNRQGGLSSREVRFQRRDGSEFTAVLNDTVVRAEDGSPKYYDGALHDITERKQAEEALREERDRFATLFESLPTPVVRCVVDDEVPLIADVNDAFESVFGLSMEDAEGRDLNRLLEPAEDADRAPRITRSSIEGGPLQVEVQCEVAEGIRDFQLQVAGRRRGDGTTEVYAIYLDVTERKRRENVLVEAKEEAEEAAQLKSAMLANMSHEVRTPLMSMIGYADLLREELAGNAGEMVEHIYESGQRLHETLDAVLRLSRLESGAYELTYTSVELNGLLDEVIEEFRSRAAAENVELAGERLEKGGAAQLDERATSRILTNLVDNACKFTGSGGAVHVRVHLEEDEAVVFEVEDTGIGISDDALPTVFEAFKQESQGLARKYEGSGLGLSIAHRLTELMGGTLDIESEKDAGTTVTVRLPRRVERALVTAGRDWDREEDSAPHAAGPAGMG